jgi:hypothetical protein
VAVLLFSIASVGNNPRKGMFMVLWKMTRMCLLIMFCLEAGFLYTTMTGYRLDVQRFIRVRDRNSFVLRAPRNVLSSGYRDLFGGGNTTLT